MLDVESSEWIGLLRAGDDEAVGRLHKLLLRAARFEIGRRRHTLPHLRGDDWDDLAEQAADDALVAVLRKLSDFRGNSRFTTWAYKFALYEAADMLRRRAWQGRELPLTEEGWEVLASPAVAAPAETSELFAAIAEGISEHLTTHQRDVLVAVALNDVPIDVMAERLATTRGALYKTLHDARRKLRAYLDDRGFDVSGATDG